MKNTYKNGKYVVDTKDKPQDPGNVNLMCLERQKLDELRKIKASRNTITVNNVDRYSELENALGYKKMEFSQSRSRGSSTPGNQNVYGHIDPTTKKVVYIYHQEESLQNVSLIEERNEMIQTA